MSNLNHPWCSNTARDEAIRRAEDAISAERPPLPDHRELPDAVAELRERVANIEALVGKAAVAGVFDGVGVPPSPATRPGETTAKHPVPHADGRAIVHIDTGDTIDERGGVPADGLRTERVTLSGDDLLAMIRDAVAPIAAERDAAIRERDAAKEECERLRGASKGSGVFDGNGDEMPWEGVVAMLTAEREMLRRCPECNGEGKHDSGGMDASGEWIMLPCEGCACAGTLDGFVRESEKLSARVAELEAAAALAANAGGGSNQEPVLFGVRWDGSSRIESWDVRNTAEQAARLAATDGTAVPLYTAPVAESATTPQPPRGWLTEEEREALKWFCGGVWPISAEQAGQWRTAIQSLLARSSPPRVKVPKYFPMSWAHERDDAWIAAIREAGGEVD